MKKLIVAAFAAFVGIAAHAGAAYWDVGNVYDYVAGTSTTLNDGYVAYFFNNADVASDSFLTTFMADSEGTIALGVEGADYVTGGATEQEGGSYTGGQNLTGYIVIFNNEDALKADHLYVTDSQTTLVPGGGATANFNDTFDASGSKYGTNWQAVPEPTSGLLLLLGVAGLALKRKRA